MCMASPTRRLICQSTVLVNRTYRSTRKLLHFEMFLFRSRDCLNIRAEFVQRFDDCHVSLATPCHTNQNSHSSSGSESKTIPPPRFCNSKSVVKNSVP